MVFVPYTAPEDVVALGPLETKGTYARAWPLRWEKTAPLHTPPRCPLYFVPGRTAREVCGGCDWQHLTYEAQTAAKRTLVIESLQRLGKIAKPRVDPTVTVDGPEGPWRYRNKVQIPFALGNDGKIIGGFYAPGSHTVVPLDDCFIQSTRSVAVFKAVRDFFRVRPVTVYNPATERGWLRHLLIRTTAAGDTLAALVTQAGPVPRELIERLREKNLGVTSVFQNINARPGNAVLSARWVHLAGRPHLEERLLGLRLRLSPGAFFQVHHAMAEKLYTLAVDMAAVGPEDEVWELYAGVGAMGQLLAKKARGVVAIEENPHAVRDGVESSQWNGLRNIHFRVDRCERVVPRLKEKPSVVLLDPPRAGCDPKVLKAVMARGPKRVVYVSCDPATLARDARYLSTGGYHLSRTVPVDLFPQTSHIETVSLFERPRN